MVGRTDFKGDIIYSFFVSGLIYPIFGHWIWGPNGVLATGDFLGWFFLRPAPEYTFAAQAGWTRPTDVELGYRLRRAA